MVVVSLCTIQMLAFAVFAFNALRNGATTESFLLSLQNYYDSSYVFICKHLLHIMIYFAMDFEKGIRRISIINFICFVFFSFCWEYYVYICVLLYHRVHSFHSISELQIKTFLRAPKKHISMRYDGWENYGDVNVASIYYYNAILDWVLNKNSVW